MRPTNLMPTILCLGLVGAGCHFEPQSSVESETVTVEYIAHACFRIRSPGRTENE